MTRRCRYNNMLKLLHRHTLVHAHFSSTSYVCRKKKIKSTFYIHCVQFYMLSFIYVSMHQYHKCITSITGAENSLNVIVLFLLTKVTTACIQP